VIKGDFKALKGDGTRLIALNALKSPLITFNHF